MGYLHLYCGDGKGKTTAALGLALRMAGAGKPVIIARFLKNDDSGEVKALRQVAGITVFPCEKTFGFTWNMKEEQKKEAALYYGLLLEQAWKKAEILCREETLCRTDTFGRAEAFSSSGNGCPGEVWSRPQGLLILDEASGALKAGLLSLETLLTYLDGRPEGLEVVITGRRPPKELIIRAEYITEMKKKCHPYDQGVKARRGVEY